MLTERQSEIVNVAMKILVEKGMQNLTVRNVATEVGVSEAAIYRHFESKHDLLVKLLTKLQNLILPIFQSSKTPILDLEDELKELIGSIFSQIEEKPAFAIFVFTEEVFHVDAQLRPLLKEMLFEMIVQLEQLITKYQEKKKCRADISARHLANLLLGSIRLEITKWHLSANSYPLTEKGQPLANTLATLLKN
jgi:AcrR family transcriptional regulator